MGNFDHERDDWDDALREANIDAPHCMWVNRDYQNGVPVEDFLYSVIQPPERDKEKNELFGLAKSFPQVTRSGYKPQVFAKLRRQAKKHGVGEDAMMEQDANDLEKGDVESALFHEKDFGYLFRFRVRFREELSEFWGMFVFMAMAIASTCQMFLGYPMFSGFICMTFAWGFANMTGIYIAGGYSGAHLNPVITFNLWFFRGFPFRRMFVFWAVQLCAVICATGWVFLLYYPLLRKLDPDGWSMKSGQYFTVNLRPGVPVATGFFNEVTGTMVLLTVVFTVGDSHNIAPARGMNAPVVGFILMAIGCCFGYICNVGMNPARDLGARIMLSMVGYPKEMWTTDRWWWLTCEICGPFVGGFLGAFAYDFFCFDGPESPLNMPVEVQMEGLRLLGHSVLHPFSKDTFHLHKEFARKRVKEPDSISTTDSTEQPKAQPE